MSRNLNESSRRNAPIKAASPTLQKLFAIATAKGITQTSIADACRRKQQNISGYRSGRYEPGIMTVEEIAAAVGYRLELVPIDS